MKKFVVTAGFLVCGSTAFADPAVMLGVSYNFGGVPGITLKLLSTNREDKAALAVGMSYAPGLAASPWSWAPAWPTTSRAHPWCSAMTGCRAKSRWVWCRQPEGSGTSTAPRFPLCTPCRFQRPAAGSGELLRVGPGLVVTPSDGRKQGWTSTVDTRRKKCLTSLHPKRGSPRSSNRSGF
jgi:hypothetical protein